MAVEAAEGKVPWLQTMSSLKVFISSSLPSERSGPNSTIKQFTKNVTTQECFVKCNTKIQEELQTELFSGA